MSSKESNPKDKGLDNELNPMYIPSQFPEMENIAILEAAWGRIPHRIPIWVMRQAGRYLPEFREIRRKFSFFDIVKNPELACEVTLQPIRRYDLDAAIIFSDILVVPQALGMTVEMRETVGPVLPNPLKVPADADGLIYDVDVQEAMKGTLQAITLTRHKLRGKVPLIGFSGAPWTLLSYMIEGGGSRTLSKSKSWLYKYPEKTLEIMHKIGDVVARYLVEQIYAGAQLLQIFESHADLLSPDLFLRFCLPVLKRIEFEVRRMSTSRGLNAVPMIVFAKGAHYALKELGKSLYNVIGIDWTMDPNIARALTGSDKTVQGNLDPCALYGNKETIESSVSKMLSYFSTRRYICNLGHGIYPNTPTESVKYFIDAVHNFVPPDLMIVYEALAEPMPQCSQISPRSRELIIVYDGPPDGALRRAPITTSQGHPCESCYSIYNRRINRSEDEFPMLRIMNETTGWVRNMELD